MILFLYNFKVKIVTNSIVLHKKNILTYFCNNILDNLYDMESNKDFNDVMIF